MKAIDNKSNDRLPDGPSRSRIGSPGKTNTNAFAGLHGTVGNQSMLALLQSRRLQAKLAVGKPNDPLEREADRVADHVVGMRDSNISPAPPVSNSVNNGVQRKCAACEHDEEQEAEPPKISALQSHHVQRACAACEEEEEESKLKIQAKCDNGPESAGNRGFEAFQSGGRPLPRQTQNYFAPRFGRDFGHVRIHNDHQAGELAGGINAKAFTVGSHIGFAPGQYAPETKTGRRLLAHELTHTVQQGPASPNQVQPFVQRVVALPASVEQVPEYPPDLEIEPDETSSESEDALGIPEEKMDDQTLWDKIRALLKQDSERTEAPAADETETIDDFSEGPEFPFNMPEEGEETLQPHEEPGLDYETDAPEGGEGEEIVIKEVPSPGGGGKCPQLVPDENIFDSLQLPSTGSNFDIFDILVSFIPTGFGGGLVQRALTAGARWVWNNLVPQSAKEAAVDAAIEAAIKTINNMPSFVFGPVVGDWYQAGILGFLKRLRKEPAAKRVEMMERFGRILFNASPTFILGFTVGALRGFFLDGLVGIFQMIINLICLIPTLWNFVTNFIKVLGVFPDFFVDLVMAFDLLQISIRRLATGAISEVKKLLSSPKQLIKMLSAVNKAGKAMAEAVGEKFADMMIKIMSGSDALIGEKMGRLVGLVAFEAVLSFLLGAISGGAGAVANIAVASIKVAVKSLLGMVLRFARALFKVLKPAIRVLGKISTWIKSFASLLKATPLMQRVAFRIGGVIDVFKDFLSKIPKFCRPGSIRCRRPKGVRAKRKQAKSFFDRERKKPGKDKGKCKPKKIVPPLGGPGPHTAYPALVSRAWKGTPGGGYDVRVSLKPGSVLWMCNYDGWYKKTPRTLVEAKTGYGWLNSPVIRRRWWFKFAVAKLDEQRFRCLAIATRCGIGYVWAVEDANARAYLSRHFGGVPPVVPN